MSTNASTLPSLCSSSLCLRLNVFANAECKYLLQLNNLTCSPTQSRFCRKNSLIFPRSTRSIDHIVLTCVSVSQVPWETNLTCSPHATLSGSTGSIELGETWDSLCYLRKAILMPYSNTFPRPSILTVVCQRIPTPGGKNLLFVYISDNVLTGVRQRIPTPGGKTYCHSLFS